LVSVAWIFFRAESLTEAIDYLVRMVTTLNDDFPEFLKFLDQGKETLISISVMLLVEWFQRHRDHGFDFSQLKFRWLRWLIYYLTIYGIFYYGGEPQDFIYFQF
ncbi:hypothetical protein N9170_02970, partial [Akkermansiaceae bacterium]|nr:hypothetical protein [Akkermansiaceae bacterium]